MIDTTLSVYFKDADIQIFLLTEAAKNGNIYRLTVMNGPTQTQDTFDNFPDAFDSFNKIVNTLMSMKEE